MSDEALQTTVIRPQSGWPLLDLAELWQHRELVYFLAWRDVKVRYKQTALGAAWAVLQPALMMAVMAVVFGRLSGVSSAGLPYPIFVYAGLLPWLFFSSATVAAANSVVQSERLITKVYFPRLAVPLAAIAAALIDFVVAFSLLFALMFWYGVFPGASALLLPPALILLVLAAVAVGTLLAALNVAYRDFRYIVAFLVQLWMFATPSIYMDYPAETAPAQAAATNSSTRPQDGSTPRSETLESAGRAGPPAQSLLRRLIQLNPMTALIAFFRATTLDLPLPWTALAVSAAEIAAGLVVAVLYFKRVEDSFADII